MSELREQLRAAGWFIVLLFGLLGTWCGGYALVGIAINATTGKDRGGDLVSLIGFILVPALLFPMGIIMCIKGWKGMQR